MGLLVGFFKGYVCPGQFFKSSCLKMNGGTGVFYELWFKHSLFHLEYWRKLMFSWFLLVSSVKNAECFVEVLLLL